MNQKITDEKIKQYRTGWIETQIKMLEKKVEFSKIQLKLSLIPPNKYDPSPDYCRAMIYVDCEMIEQLKEIL